MKNLAGKTALITGSDSGIGRAIAMEFARNGADVAVCYHTDQEGAEEVSKEIIALGRKSVVIKVDVSEEASVKRMFDETIKALGKINILVNNAAVNTSDICVADMSSELFDRTIKTNLYSVFYCCKAFIQHVRNRSIDGKIINVSSIHEDVVMPGGADYNASKGALKNFTKTLAMELASENIPVNNIAPGMILTPMNQEAVDDPQVRKEAISHIPMQRAGKPEEIAKLALFLASEDSSYVTGTTFTMDGGLSISLGQGA